MGNNTWNNVLDPQPGPRGTAKNTFTTLQEVAGTAADHGLLPISQANELKVGSKIEIDAVLEFSCTATPTLQLGFIYNATPGAAGGTTLALSSAITLGSGAAAWPAILRWQGKILSIGAPGANSVIYGHGCLMLGTSLTAFAAPVPIPITAALRQVSIDASIRALWGVGAAFSASNAANQVRVDDLSVKVTNQGKPS